MRAQLLPMLLLACTPSRTYIPDKAPPPEDVAPSQEVISAMHLNLAGVATTHEAIVRGDLAGARAAAKVVAAAPRIERIPEPWIDFQVAMRLEAAKFGEVDTLEAAAKGAVALAGKCAACHEFVAVGPRFYAKSPPLDRGDLASHMAVHAWGADLMWKGLLSADTDVYTKGALALGESSSAWHADDGVDPTVAALGRAVHDAGAAGAGASSPDERAAAYASALTTCAACHEKVGASPTVPWAPTLKAPADR
jgi:cytochrome c553